MAISTLKYRLPRSCLVVSGTVRRTRDEIDPDPAAAKTLAESVATLVSVNFRIVTEADTAEQTVKPPRGWWRSYKGSFTTTSDGRLSKASGESTGQVGTILKSVAGIAGAVVGVAALREFKGDTKDLQRLLGAKPHELLAYKDGNSAEYALGVRLATAQVGLREQIAVAIIAGAGQAGGRGRLAELQSLSRAAAAQLTQIAAHYAAWRATKFTTVDESFEFRVQLADIPTALPVHTADEEWKAAASEKSAALPTSLSDIWERFGAGVTATWLTDRRNSDQVPTVANNEIVIRRPDPLELCVTEQRSGVAVTTSRTRHLVVDQRSVHETFELEKSFFGRRSVDLAFDGDGFLTGVGFEGSSALADALENASALPGSFSGGIEGATKVSTALVAARRASADAELARVKQEVELRQQRLTAAGLDATEGDAVRVQRLQQLQSILEAQTKIVGADPGLVAELAGAAGGDLSWYSPPPPAAPPEPQVIRVEIDRRDRTADSGDEVASPALGGHPPTNQ